jgi:hypothetical protein
MHGVELPSSALNFPDPQAIQAFAPVSGMYLPAGQYVHASALLAPSTVENLPAMQSVQTAAAAAEYLPAAQFVHAPAPGSVL